MLWVLSPVRGVTSISRGKSCLKINRRDAPVYLGDKKHPPNGVGDNADLNQSCQGVLAIVEPPDLIEFLGRLRSGAFYFVHVRLRSLDGLAVDSGKRARSCERLS